MVKVTSPAVTQIDKEKCLAAVQKREDVTLSSVTAQETRTAEQKPVISIAEGSAEIKTETDVVLPKSKDTSKNNESQIKDEIRTDSEEKMDMDVCSTKEHLQSNKPVKMEIDSGAIVENSPELKITETNNASSNKNKSQTVVQSEVTSSGSEVVSNAKSENARVTDSDAVCEPKVQIQVSVSGEMECTGVAVPSTAAQTDVTIPLTIQTKFGGTPNVSPG